MIEKPNPLLAQQIDLLLPQTQCGLCGYAGCKPYAEAIAENKAAINLCPPGGIITLKKLGRLLDKDISSYLADMEQKTKPARVAFIHEDQCIGCTKCIQACPVDAILGSAKLMHTVISSECTGCELCIQPCPVDCIEMQTIPTVNEMQQRAKADVARQRYHARQQRLQEQQNTSSQLHQRSKLVEHKDRTRVLAARKAAIRAAVARFKAKRQQELST